MTAEPILILLLKCMIFFDNPKLVIIGGDFSAAGRKFLDPVEESARRHIFDFSTKNIRIESSKANGDSGIKAAAFMAIAGAAGYK